MIIAISLILCFFVFNQQANAEMPIWDKIDYEEFFGTEEYTGFTGYAIRTDNTFLNKYRYFYVFASSAGGMGVHLMMIMVLTVAVLVVWWL